MFTVDVKQQSNNKINLGAYISFFVKVLIEKYDSVSNELNFSDFY